MRAESIFIRSWINKTRRNMIRLLNYDITCRDLGSFLSLGATLCTHQLPQKYLIAVELAFRLGLLCVKSSEISTNIITSTNSLDWTSRPPKKLVVNFTPIILNIHIEERPPCRSKKPNNPIGRKNSQTQTTLTEKQQLIVHFIPQLLDGICEVQFTHLKLKMDRHAI